MTPTAQGVTDAAEASSILFSHLCGLDPDPDPDPDPRPNAKPDNSALTRDTSVRQRHLVALHPWWPCLGSRAYVMAP